MRRRTLLLGLALWLASAAHASAAMDARLVEVRAAGATLRISVELHDVFSEKFLALLNDKQPLYVRLQTELWEDRPIWDKLVRPAIVSVFRIIRDPDSHLHVADAIGTVASIADTKAAVALRADVAPVDAVRDAGKYYVRLVATVGTIETSEARAAGDDMFGRDESVSMAGLGKLIFRTVVQITDYLQSVTSEAKTTVVEGRALKAGVRLR